MYTEHACGFSMCNVDIVLFYNITCYTKSLLSCIYVNIAYLLDITCTLVAMGMILGRFRVYMHVDSPCGKPLREGLPFLCRLSFENNAKIP